MKYTFKSGDETITLDHLPQYQMLYTPGSSFKTNDVYFQNWLRVKEQSAIFRWAENARILRGPELRSKDLNMPLAKSFRFPGKYPRTELRPTTAQVFRLEDGSLTGMLPQYIIGFKKQKSELFLGKKDKIEPFIFSETLSKIWHNQEWYVGTARQQVLPEFFAGMKSLQENLGDDLEFVHPNFIGLLQLDASDANYNLQWALNPNALVGSKSPRATIDIESAWNKITSQNIPLATTPVMVLDQGIFPHNDLQFNQLVTNGTTLTHGIKVCGVLGALQNQIGITGVSPRVSQSTPTAFSLQGKNFPANYDTVTTEQMAVDQATWVKGFLQSVAASQTPPKVLNLSFNFLGYPKTQILKSTLTELARKMLICVSSGNFKPGGQSGSENTPGYPAYLPGIVLPVGALDIEARRVSLANGHSWASKYGFLSGDAIMAPGVDVYTTDKNSAYSFFSGTSAAAPLVSGVAALLFAVRPNCMPAQIRQVLLDSASRNVMEQTQNLSANVVGKGMVQAGKALDLLLSRFP
jgi:hypothetical protein